MEKKIQNIIKDTQDELGPSLLSCDIWMKESGLSIGGYNQNEKFTLLMNTLMTSFQKGLESLGFPPIGKYQIIDLDMNSLILIINLNEKQIASLFLDKSNISFGTLFHSIIPRFIKNMEID